MTDQELLELATTKAPEELSPAEIEALRAALPRSAELRAALAERLDMERLLHAGLTRSAVSAADVVARAERAPRTVSGRLWRVAFWTLELVGLFILGATWWTLSPPVENDPVRQVVEVEKPVAEKASVGDAPGGAPPGLETAPADEEKTAATNTPVIAEPPAGAVLVAAIPPTPAIDKMPIDIPTAAKPPAPAPPSEPWPPLAILLAAPPPSRQDRWNDLTPATPAPNEKELRQWLAEAPGQKCSFGDHRQGHVDCSAFNGVAQLKSPWAPRTALRLSLHDFHRLRIHVWGEQGGVTLQYAQNQNRGWHAYQTTRKPGQPLPETLLLAATDEFRNARINWSDVATVDLSCDGKTLTLSRGNVRLLDAPLDGMPREVFFEGRAVVRQIALVRAVELAPEPPLGPIVFDAPEPAKQDWRTELGDGAAFNLRADGCVELTAEKIGKSSSAWLPLATGRVQEVILQFDSAHPGTGVFLGDPAGKSDVGLTFQREAKTGRLGVGRRHTKEAVGDVHFDEHETLAAYCTEKPWVKLLVGCGVARFWISADGVHWARACEPWTQDYAALGSVGIYCAPGNGPQRGLTLRRILTRELPGLAALAPLELQRRAPALTENHTAEGWLHAVYASQPPEVESGDWRRACLLRTLAVNGSLSSLGEELDNLLEETIAAGERPWQERLAALTDAARLRPYWHDNYQNQRMLDQFARLASLVAAEGHPEAYDAILTAELTAPLWCNQSHVTGFDEADREQLQRLVFAEQWTALELLANHLRLIRQIHGDQGALLSWAESLVPRVPGAPATGAPATGAPATGALATGALATGKPLIKPEWRHPLVAELSKEAYNVLAELEAALAGGAYRDACQIISTAAADGGPGLLPDSQDPRLLVSFPMAVTLAMHEHPPLAATMNEQFGAVGRLRVRQAMVDDDVTSIEAAIVQFTGTEAAAEAHLWLADRALAGGAFAQALAHYRESAPAIGSTNRDRVAAGAQLAAAMMGERFGDELTGIVTIGDAKLPAADFNKLLDDLRKRHAPAGAAPAAAASESAANSGPAPAPSGFETPVRGRFDGDAGQAPQDVPGEQKHFDIDWVARQCAVGIGGDRLIFSNRFQVAAFNFQSNQFDWRSPLGVEPAAAHDWPLVPMRPLVAGNRIYARRLPKPGPVLACLDAADGRALWTTKAEPDKFVVSDPVLIQEQLFALTATRVDQEFQLALSGFDPASGAVVGSRPLARLREQWWQERTCELLALGDTLVVATGGSVLRVDLLGRIHWLRRQTWRPAAIDPGWLDQSQAPPLAADGRIFLIQPGVGEALALEAESGRLAWRTPLVTARRILGRVDERLVVETREGLIGLSTADGSVVWRQPLANLLNGFLMGSDRLLVARNTPTGQEKQLFPMLVWIDPATGAELASWPMDSLRHERPRLGPLVVAQDRLFALAGRGEQDPAREILELTARGEAAKAPATLGLAEAIWRRKIDPALLDATAEVLPKWILLGGGTDRRQPYRLAEWQGEQQVLEVPASSGRPFSLLRRVKFPAGESAKLVLRVASDAKWKLEVQAAGQPAHGETLTRESTGGGWKDIEVDLGDLAGRTTWLMVRQIDEDGSQPVVRWKSLELRF